MLRWRSSTRLEPMLVRGMLVFIPASFLGARIAKGLVDRIPQTHFRKVIAACLLAIGIKLLIWPG